MLGGSSVAAFVSLLFWIAVALDRKRAWPRELVLSRGEATSASPELAGHGPLVVIPARNEAAVLEETLPALLAQVDSAARIVLVDDRSEDGTGALARALADRCARPDRVTIVEGEGPPEGWTGKLHALASGLREGLLIAGEDAPDWVLFTDADIRHSPGSLAALAAKAREGRDLVSIMARLRAQVFWERLLIPPFVYFFQLLYPFRRVADPRSRVAAAAGGCVLIRRELLERIGSLESIHAAVIDDVALARRAKDAGGRLWLGFDPEIVSARGYGGFREIARMVARTAFHQLSYSLALLLGTFVFLGLFFAAPPAFLVAGALGGSAWLAVFGLAAWAIETWSFLPAVRHHRVSPAYALTLPLAAVLYGYMTGLSAWRHLRGAGIEWKGRQV